MSLRDQIAKARDITLERIEVPEWGITVGVKSLTVGEREEYQAGMISALQSDGTIDVSQVHLGEQQRTLVALCAVDPETEDPIFEGADDPVLINANAGVMEKLFQSILDISGMREDAVDEAGKDSSVSPTTEDS